MFCHGTLGAGWEEDNVCFQLVVKRIRHLYHKLNIYLRTMNGKKEANPAREIKNEGALHSFALKSLIYMMLRSTERYSRTLGFLRVCLF